jgi:hypothetical protein
MREEINITAAYIVGTVSFPDLRGMVAPPDVEVTAVQERLRSSTTVRGSAGKSVQYCLVIGPGKWLVHAKCGPLSSDPKPVTLKPGECFDLDFRFGAAT